MRMLANNEIHQISGAITVTINDCYSADDLAFMHEDASHEATIFACLTGSLAAISTSAAANYLGAGYVTTGMVGAIAGLAVYAYAYPAAYNSYELWPWNY